MIDYKHFPRVIGRGFWPVSKRGQVILFLIGLMMLLGLAGHLDYEAEQVLQDDQAVIRRAMIERAENQERASRAYFELVASQGK